MKKTNNIFHLWLLGALVCGLGLSVTSCKDDDEEKVDERIVTEDGKTYVPDSLLTDHERYQLACQSAVISTMRNLAGLESVTPNVVNETHEPTYGMTLDDAGATVRVMKCESAAAAELSFRAIAGLDSTDAVRMYTPTPDGYQLDLRNMPILPDGKTLTLGTLTFHRDGGPRRHGYVEVDIPCIPHLERIDYLSAEAFPDNAGTNSAYQLGDIVMVPRSSGLCSGYYVCVANNGYRSTLVHMKRGVNPGDDVGINVDDDNAGCWIPYNNKHGHKTTFEDICDYVSFILMNQNKVANIKTFLEGKAYNMKPTVSGMLWHVFPEGFNNDMGVAFYNTWGGTARIFYDGSITSDYAVIPAYYYRNAIYAKVPSGCNSSDQVTSDNKRYVTDKEWDHWMGYSEYTMNVIHTNSTVSGSTLEYSPMKDYLETIDSDVYIDKVAKFKVPSFDNSYNVTLIKDVYAKDEWVAQVCNEYIPSIDGNKRVTVVYPVVYNVPRYKKGFFIGDNNHKPARVSWNGTNAEIEVCEDLSYGAATELSVSGTNISTTSNEEMNTNVTTTTDIRDEYLAGQRLDPSVDADRPSNYPLVKIFDKVWTRETYKHYVGTHVSTGYTVEMDGKTVEGRNVCYYPDVAANGSNWPEGWQVASWNDDYKPMFDKLAANGFSKPALALFNRGVTGFELCFEGWFGRWTDYTWYFDTQMHGTRDGIGIWFWTDGTYYTESWWEKPNRQPVRLVKKK